LFGEINLKNIIYLDELGKKSPNNKVHILRIKGDYYYKITVGS